MSKVTAFQIADSIDIKRFRKEYTGTESYANNFEVFYGNSDGQFLYVQGYGVVVFSGYDEIQISENIDYLKQFVKNTLPEKLREDFSISENRDHDIFGYNEIQVTRLEPEVMRIIMMYVGESVALDYFNQQAEQLLDETNKYTLQLELKGDLKLSAHNLRRFIGKTLNMKNRIADSLYIIDSPEETWENEYLSKIAGGLQNIFDIRMRHKEVDFKLQTIRDNLDLFKDLLQHRRSNQLEIIIIALILVEVGNLFLEKILHWIK